MSTVALAGITSGEKRNTIQHFDIDILSVG